MNNMNDPNNKVTTPVDGGTSPATTKMFFALGNVNNNINNNINNNNNGNNNNNNNNGYRLLSAQGMETLQAKCANSDCGYPLRPWLLTPIVNAEPGTPEQHYTRAHSI
ncbi:unnamed protein product [Callosobruchus maculatus]|uniref:Uncharacterized protein n=1 Tax=Callosobruchus maculatus TaxID=64391 RepID=A0A653D7J8_CALMS|nr:unnamed protein product [Callosobruchus maculatus]